MAKAKKKAADGKDRGAEGLFTGPADAGPKYPQITVKLSENDGNAYTIMGLVMRALRRGGVPAQDVAAFQQEACSGDYDHLLQTVFRWVDVE